MPPLEPDRHASRVLALPSSLDAALKRLLAFAPKISEDQQQDNLPSLAKELLRLATKFVVALEPFPEALDILKAQLSEVRDFVERNVALREALESVDAILEKDYQGRYAQLSIIGKAL